MDDQLRDLAHQVFGLLNRYIEVHNDMLGRKWFAKLRAIDFTTNAGKLSRIELAVQNARSQALALQGDLHRRTRHHEFLQVLVSYVDALSHTVALLRNVADNLSQVARGGNYPYPMDQYRQDMDSYNNSVGRYRSIGETLKAAWEKAGL